MSQHFSNATPHVSLFFIFPLNCFFFFAEIVYLVSFIASWLTSQPEDKSNQQGGKVIFGEMELLSRKKMTLFKNKKK